MNLLKTILPNQLVMNGNFESASGWRTTHATISALNNTMVITPTIVDEYVILSSLNIDNYNGHKILYLSTITEPVNNVIAFGDGSEVLQSQNITANTRTIIAQIISAPDRDIRFNIYLNWGNTLASGQIITVENCMLIDLTLLYGQGLEPSTIQQFRADYPLDYYPYSLTNTTGLLTCANGAVTADISSMLPSGIGCVDLGTVEWTRANVGDIYFFYHQITDMPSGADAVCSKYTKISGALSSDQKFSTDYYYWSKSIHIRDDAYTDATAFKNANAGVLLFYKKTT